MPLRHGLLEWLLKRHTGATLARLPCASLWQRPASHVLGVCEQLEDSRPEIKQGNREELITFGQMKKLHFITPKLALLVIDNK